MVKRMILTKLLFVVFMVSSICVASVMSLNISSIDWFGESKAYNKEYVSAIEKTNRIDDSYDDVKTGAVSSDSVENEDTEVDVVNNDANVVYSGNLDVDDTNLLTVPVDNPPSPLLDFEIGDSSSPDGSTENPSNVATGDTKVWANGADSLEQVIPSLDFNIGGTTSPGSDQNIQGPPVDITDSLIKQDQFIIESNFGSTGPSEFIPR